METIKLTGRHICQSEEEITTVTELLPTHIVLTRAEPGVISLDGAPSGARGVWDVSECFKDVASFEEHQARV
jgi:quinol monooxygenase YgiN